MTGTFTAILLSLCDDCGWKDFANLVSPFRGRQPNGSFGRNWGDTCRSSPDASNLSHHPVLSLDTKELQRFPQERLEVCQHNPASSIFLTAKAFSSRYLVLGLE